MTTRHSSYFIVFHFYQGDKNHPLSCKTYLCKKELLYDLYEDSRNLRTPKLWTSDYLWLEVNPTWMTWKVDLTPMIQPPKFWNPKSPQTWRIPPPELILSKLQISLTWQPCWQPSFKNGRMEMDVWWFFNHFLKEDVLHHPLDVANQFINAWVSLQ